MRFEYEISPDEYVAGHMAYYLAAKGRRRYVQRGLFWLAVGLFFFYAAWNEQVLSWAPILLSITGAYCIYWGLANLFLEVYFRLHYRRSGVRGKKYRAELDEMGFEVAGEECTWRIPWAGVSAKRESKRVFIVYAANTVFIFGKNYLRPENQNELRRLAGLQS
jgi:hypothetical protein